MTPEEYRQVLEYMYEQAILHRLGTPEREILDGEFRRLAAKMKDSEYEKAFRKEFLCDPIPSTKKTTPVRDLRDHLRWGKVRRLQSKGKRIPRAF